MDNKDLGWSDWLGIRPDLKRAETRWLGRILGQAILIVALAIVLMFILTFGLIFHAIFSLDDGADVRNVGLVLAAIIGAPFVVWRAIVAQQQANTALQGLITDRISKAVEGLGAEKTLSRVGRPVTYEGGGFRDAMAKASGDQSDHTVIEWQGEPVIADAQNVFGKGGIKKRGDWQVFVETKPNLEVRIGSIYALERISQDSPRDHVQIMEILCAYIRENSPTESAKDFPEPKWQPLSDDADNEVRAAHFAEGDARFGETSWNSRAWRWAQRLRPRTDIQVATQVIGRRTKAQVATEQKDMRHGPEGYRLDLRGANLQGVNLHRPELRKALLSGARMEGAIIYDARMEEANLIQARFEGAYLWGARLNKANLRGAHMEGANFTEAQMQGAVLTEASMEGTNLMFAVMQGANLMEASMERAYLLRAQMEGAKLDNAQLAGARLMDSQLRGAQFSWTRMEGANLENAWIEGADFGHARMEGAYLGGVTIDEKTNFNCAVALYAAVKSCDLRQSNINQDQVKAMFGDGSVILPHGIDRPAHWLEGETDWGDFEKAWRDWQAKAGYVSPAKGE